MKSSRLIWAFVGCLASLSANAQVTIVDATDHVAVFAETPEAKEVSVGWGVTNLGGQTQYLVVTRTIEDSVEPWDCPYSGKHWEHMSGFVGDPFAILSVRRVQVNLRAISLQLQQEIPIGPLWRIITLRTS